MNRGSVILLCLTTVVIFFMITEKPKLDIEKYENEISTLQSKINQLECVNDSLTIEASVLNEKLAEYTNTILQLNNEIDVIQDKTKRKLDSVDRFNRDELQKFFTERYRINSSSSN